MREVIGATSAFFVAECCFVVAIEMLFLFLSENSIQLQKIFILVTAFCAFEPKSSKI